MSIPTPRRSSPPQHLEDIALFNVEVDLPYKDWYDDHAKVLDIGPGQMLGWQMNAPHRVENLDTFNVSMTISYTNEEIRRARDRQPRQRHAAPSLRLYAEDAAICAARPTLPRR